MPTVIALNRAQYLHQILLHQTWYIENFSEPNKEYHYLRHLLAYRGIRNIYLGKYNIVPQTSLKLVPGGCFMLVKCLTSIIELWEARYQSQ